MSTHLRRDGILTSLSPWNHQILNLLHAMRLNIGACINEVNCEADRFLERHWILFPAIQVRVWSAYLKEAALNNY